MRDLTDVHGLDLTDEVFEVLHQAGGAVVERIVSSGQASQWFDQDHDEWVMVLSGSADLEYANGATVHISAGQGLVIPASVRHRVVRTARPTIWVAVHFPSV